MKNWNSEGHLTDLARELWAAGEAEGSGAERTQDHLQSCSSCRAQVEEWREIFHALSSLPALEPSLSFDRRVMDRVRMPVAAPSEAAWLPTLVRRLRPVAVATSALWSAVVVGGIIWLGAGVGTSGTALVAGAIAYLSDLAWGAVVKVGAFLHISGTLELWAEFARVVPGPGVLSAVALMTAFAGLGIWGLYRVAGIQPTRVNAHV